jgi:twitching motility protein PilI
VASAPSAEVAHLDYYLIALNTALDVNCALLVDRLVGLKSVDSFASSVPPGDGDPAFFGNVYTDSTHVLWQEINLQSLSKNPRFLSISA